jgi:multiple antibiotic resistance protein
VADAVKVFFLIISALFPIVDPLSGSPIFLAMTSDYSPFMRRALSRRVAWNSLFLMIGSYFIGSYVLKFFGVSLPVVQVGGGLVVSSMGWGMLVDKQQVHDVTRDNGQSPDAFNQAFYPLTLPLTVGPGSISVAVTLGANSTHDYGVRIPVILAAVIAMFLIAVSIYLCYGFADRLAQAFGKNAMIVIVRLSSFLLLCIGVQIMWNGVRALVSSLHYPV